ncbi:MAG TPA: hypothetical protein VF552_01600 [Allosphingosinicella sp.]|jgi:hypothetical protein
MVGEDGEEDWERGGVSLPDPHAGGEVRMEDLPAFLRFAPVPVKARRDGWTPELQHRFVLALAEGAGVDEAARGLGRTRQGAYRLRARPGAPGRANEFARAWDAAVEFAREVAGAAAEAGLPMNGIETVLVPRYYRGRLVGFVQREHAAGLMRTLAQLYRAEAQYEAREAARARARKARGAPPPADPPPAERRRS